VGSGNAVDAVGEVCGLHSDVIAKRGFPAELDSVRAARHVTAGLLEGEAARDLAQCAAIVVTELASNAVVHACSGFTLTVSRSATAVRIAVRDDSPLVPRDDGRPFEIQAGHGLSVVAQLARAWNVEGLPDGKVVWAELTEGMLGLWTMRTRPAAGSAASARSSPCVTCVARWRTMRRSASR